MISTFVKWVGLETLSAEELAKLRKPIEKAVMKTTLYYEAKVKLSLTGPRSGRIYGSHQASAPGEAPATRSGALRQSITHTMGEWTDDGYLQEVVSLLPYARRLEFGGVDSRGIRILPRPYFSAVWIAEQDTMQSMLDQAVKV